MKNTIARFIAGTAFALVAMFGMSSSASASTEITRNLFIGKSGADVTALQTFLAQDVTIYPQGRVTGYYGSLTKSAVSNFQARNSLSTDGYVGPMTRGVLNAQMNGGIMTNDEVATISNVTVTPTKNNATIYWNTSEPAKGMIYYSSSPLITMEHENSVDVSGSIAMTDSDFRGSQNISINGLQSNTTYYYMAYVTDRSGYVSVTWPSTFRTTN